MPYPNEHAARIENPDKYEKTRRENNKFGEGIHAIWGILKGGKTELQAIRFDKTKFTVEQAKKWLNEHDYKPIAFEPASKKDRNMQGMEIKVFPFELTEVKTEKRNGVDVGIIEGYASTFNNIDEGRDVVLPGAFLKTIDDFKARKRQVRMFYQHDRMQLIGGYPPEFIREDGKGLFVHGECNLEVQKGREAYALAKQGVMQDFSIGFRAIEFEVDTENDIRKLKEVKLWEVSPVADGMNTMAQVTAVKHIAPEFLEDDRIYEMLTIKEVSDFLKEREFRNEEVKALIVKIKELSNRQNADDAVQKAGQDLDYFFMNKKLDAALSVLKSN